MNLINRLNNSADVLLSDGATGTFLQERGLEPGGCPELMNIDSPEAVMEMAEGYFTSGSDFVLTNSFGGSPFMLKKYGYEEETEKFNREAAKLAKIHCPEDGFVVGSIGPTGEFLEPLGSVTVDQMSQGFMKQISGLLEGGVDGIIFETQMAIEELKLGISVAKNMTDLPVIGSMVFDKGPRGFFTMMGVSPEKACFEIKESGADVIATNCGNGSKVMAELAKELLIYTELPLMIQSNAGIPKIKGGKVIYDESPDFMGKNYELLVEMGVDVIGGCCGTNFDHIKKFRKIINTAKI